MSNPTLVQANGQPIEANKIPNIANATNIHCTSITTSADVTCNGDLSVVGSSVLADVTVESLDVVADAVINGDQSLVGDFAQDGGGKFGVIGATPAAAQTGGSATAGGTYGAGEQAMLQKAYDALRTFGFLT